MSFIDVFSHVSVSLRVGSALFLLSTQCLTFICFFSNYLWHACHSVPLDEQEAENDREKLATKCQCCWENFPSQERSENKEEKNIDTGQLS